MPPSVCLVSTQIGIWSVGEGLPVRVERSQLQLEVDLEDWAADKPALLAEGLQVVARQLHVEAGTIDLLCIDAKERWVVVELKRARLYREALAQAMDYAACIGAIDGEELRASIEKGLERLTNTETVLDAVDYQLGLEDEDRDVSIVVAGAGVDPGLERVVGYLSNFEIPIRVVSFDVFRAPDGSNLLVREVFDDEAVGPVKKQRTVAEIGEIAVAEGVDEPYRRIVEAAEAAGLFCRPYKWTVMLTPSSHKNRSLMVLNPYPGHGLRIQASAEAFEEFFPELSVPTIEELLGPSNVYSLLSKDDWEKRTEVIVAFLKELPDMGQSNDQAKADAAAVFQVAERVHPGEWTTYGDLSRAVTGSSSSAQAVGNMARIMPDFPTPWRVLNLKGQIPSAWVSDQGEGSEKCRQLLEEEGVTFDEDGTASAKNRLPLEELVSRTSN